MKKSIEKLLREVTNGKFLVIFDAKLKRQNEWSFIIVYDWTNGEYIAGWNKTTDFNVDDLKHFEWFYEAKNYIIRRLL